MPCRTNWYAYQFTPHPMSTTPSIYRKIAEPLRERISKDDYSSDGFVVAEHAPARDFKVSRGSARQAFELLIDEGILVRQAGKGLYLGHRKIAQKHTTLLVENLAWDNCREFVQGAQKALNAVDWRCDVLNRGERFEEPLRLIRQLVEHPKATDGAILLAWHTSTFFEIAFNIRKAGIPLVIADYAARELQVAGIISDNYRGGQLRGEHLLEMGHRRIAFIGDTFATTIGNSLEGLREALAEGSIPLPKSIVFDLLPNQSESSWAHDIDYAM
ncbi:MAG: hypothetical protein SPK06_03000, partial [Kiritimatiellia bacterium]|nr:hypothetical protein [Kiritimatiellia bacterium]